MNREEQVTDIIMYGCNGRMGRVISEIAREDETVRIVAGIDVSGEGSGDYPVYASLRDCPVRADALIDFSSPAALEDVLTGGMERSLPLVLCTTGYTEEQLQAIYRASERTAVLRSANMSLGVNLLLDLVREAAKVLASSGFDIEIVEKHHNQKLDAPSGTALALADAANEVLGGYGYRFDRSQERKGRDKREIGISSVRGGSIVGEHEVLFAGPDEVVELKHTAYSRAVFARGAVAAAKYLNGKGAGRYGMRDVIAAQLG